MACLKYPDDLSGTGELPRPEFWGGVEGTVNRVHDRYYDQLERSGHAHRIQDLELFSSLGIRAIRYPVLWERIAPNGLENANWSWADERLSRLRELGIRPVVGLLHHGSGPPDTSLTDESSPERLAEYALAVATRYPWVEDYTPVNEPLTTARFSALYGHWFPHARDDRSFARAVANQCKGTVLAMQAIRSVQPHARLVQTEEIGPVYSTPHMAYQAAFENERRWLTFDLLTGNLDERSQIWTWLGEVGFEESCLQWFRENRCPPDILGVNYYLTSERFLDERLDHYPLGSAGSNGRDTYVDMSASRILPNGIMGIGPLLRQTWDRYRLPMAITEVHNGCSVEEQMRWLDEIWHDATAASQDGVDVRAVTIWALLGSFDWPSLVTRDDGLYERGAFDLRAPAPRPTALARMTADLATSGHHDHPILASPGWWRSPERFIGIPDNRPAETASQAWHRAGGEEPASRLVLLGRRSPLRAGIERECNRRRIEVHVLNDEVTEETLDSALSDAWAVVLTDQWCDDTSIFLASATRHPIHSDLAVKYSLAWKCAIRGLPFAAFSTPDVFDGYLATPYVESSPVSPTTPFGRQMAEMEREVLTTHPHALVLRTGDVFGPGFETLPAAMSGNEDPAYASVISPAYLPDLANATIDLLIDGESGIWHLANRGLVTRHEFERVTCDLLGIRSAGLTLCPQVPMSMRALISERGWLLPEWKSALAHYVDHHREELVRRLSSLNDPDSRVRA